MDRIFVDTCLLNEEASSLQRSIYEIEEISARLLNHISRFEDIDTMICESLMIEYKKIIRIKEEFEFLFRKINHISESFEDCERENVMKVTSLPDFRMISVSSAMLMKDSKMSAENSVQTSDSYLFGRLDSEDWLDALVIESNISEL